MKTSQLKMIIREVVREEIRLGLQEIIGDLKQPKRKVVQPKRKTIEKQDFSSNPLINEVLNETAATEVEWKQMGGETYTSDKMSDVLSNAYKDIKPDNPNGTLAAERGVNPDDAPDFLTKDYRKVMKAVDKKQGK